MNTLFVYEEECLKQEYDFKLHYALSYGDIDTEINPDIAYEMMGPGLTKARKLLYNKSRSRKRFEFDLENELRSK